LSRPAPRNRRQPGQEPIPFYRNIKVIGLLAQLLFLFIAVGALVFFYRNVSSALDNSNLSFSFGFLDGRAGFDLAEKTIPFSASDTYLRAIVVGLVNTLKVGLTGIVLCSLLGVAVGVMRLSRNWLLRTLATSYVELLRNTPLAVQLIFWYYAVILSIPPLADNPVRILGGLYLSQIGIAMPWIYPSYNFGTWVPWLLPALAIGVILFVWRRRQIERSERPGNPWPVPIAVTVLIATVGYFVASAGVELRDGLTAAITPSGGVGRVFIDEDGDGALGRGEEPVRNAPVIVSIEEGRLEVISQNRVESRDVVYSTFRFPILDRNEFESVDVDFEQPEEAEGLDIHFLRYPSIGTIYRDRNGNDEFDPGEERYIEDGVVRGYNGIRLAMAVEGFERRLVSDRSGLLYLPIFTPPEVEGGEETEAAAPRGGGGLGALFNRTARVTGTIEVSARFPAPGPLVYSEPTVPRSGYFGGVQLSTAFLALLLGLAIYTSAFVAEIVRGGIQAVPRGQGEAASALGLSGVQRFLLIVFPQALRIIIPPMISQYLNLIKNSSLAILVTFSDFFQVANTVGNQTGQFLSVFVIILVGYLTLSLVFSFILNIVNARIALVER
jgi:His/Glu/Gln/Arg/opine family amino acid ABC transporter permease subunit